MEVFSILNDVLGSIMRGPSSSHTAGSCRIGSLVRSLSGGEPSRVEVTFDPEGSLAPTYVPLGVDIAFVAGRCRLDVSVGPESFTVVQFG